MSQPNATEKEYHPSVKIVLIEKKTYESILKSMGKLIKFY